MCHVKRSHDIPWYVGVVCEERFEGMCGRYVKRRVFRLDAQVK